MLQGTEIEEQVVVAMRQLGFTVNDGRVYVALLKHQPATGYELAARSGVPRSAIYTILRRLQGLGLVNSIQDKPARYLPLAPERLLALLEARFGRHRKQLQGALEQIADRAADASTWTVQGYAAMLEQAERLVASARTSVFASLWGREAKALEAALTEARHRGVDVVLFSFTPVDETLGRVLSYGLSEQDLGAHWQHRIILIADLRRLLVGGAEETEENRAVVTDEPALVEMAVSNLVLDITLLGERTGQKTADVVSRLTARMAPVDELLGRPGHPE